MMIKEELASKLFSLYKIILNKLKEAKIEVTPNLYIKTKIEEQTGTSAYLTRQEVFLKDELSHKDVFKFLESIKENVEYSHVVSCISKKYILNKDQASQKLNDFIINIFFDRTSESGWNYRNDITDGLLVECITIFIGDLDGNPSTWNVTLWIEGILLTQEYKISENILIRNVEISDRELEVPFHGVLLNHSFHDTPNKFSAILNVRFKGHLESVRNEVNIILISLMLLRLGSIYSKRTEYRPNSFVNHPQKVWSNTSYSNNYKYTFKNGDNSSISEIISILKKQWHLISNESNPIHIALERYSHALLKQESIEGHITSAINCLEALYLKKDERAELTHRLCQRVSVILRILGLVPIKGYNDIARAYDIRSNYIHGQIEPEKHKDAPKLGETVLDYARLSMIIFIQLIYDYNKEDLINKIDNSLLDASAFDKLKEIIDSRCKIYK
jgi:hypothetical protein